MVYWVYILVNAAGKFYIGQTHDLADRLKSHNSEGVAEGKFTRNNGPWRLVWQEEHSNRASAMAREKQIKAWKSSRMIRLKLLGQSE